MVRIRLNLPISADTEILVTQGSVSSLDFTPRNGSIDSRLVIINPIINNIPAPGVALGRIAHPADPPIQRQNDTKGER